VGGKMGGKAYDKDKTHEIAVWISAILLWFSRYEF